MLGVTAHSKKPFSDPLSNSSPPAHSGNTFCLLKLSAILLTSTAIGLQVCACAMCESTVCQRVLLRYCLCVCVWFSKYKRSHTTPLFRKISWNDSDWLRWYSVPFNPVPSPAVTVHVFGVSWEQLTSPRLPGATTLVHQGSRYKGQ